MTAWAHYRNKVKKKRFGGRPHALIRRGGVGGEGAQRGGGYTWQRGWGGGGDGTLRIRMAESRPYLSRCQVNEVACVEGRKWSLQKFKQGEKTDGEKRKIAPYDISANRGRNQWLVSFRVSQHERTKCDSFGRTTAIGRKTYNGRRKSG